MAIEVEENADILPLYAGETEDAIRERWAAWANEGLTVDDANEWTDTRVGSWWSILTTPGVRECAAIYDFMGTEVPSAAMVVWSWGDYLDDLAEGYLTERSGGTAAEGKVTFYGLANQVVNAGARVGVEVVDTDSEAQEYEVQSGGTIVDDLGAPTGLGSSVQNSGGAVPNGTFYFVVTALNNEGETVPSAQKSQAVAAGGDGIVDLTWTPKAGATGYRIYRGSVNGGPYGLIGEVTGTAFSDDGSPLPDMGITPPTTDGTGGQVTLPVRAVRTGVATNAAAGQVTVPLSSVGVADLSNLEPISGGSDPESDESLRQKVRSKFAVGGPGNIADYKQWALNFGQGIGKVVVVPTWDGGGTVLVIILTEDGDPLPASVVTALKTYLDPVDGQGEGKAPIGHSVTVTTAASVNVTVAMTIEFESGYSLDGAADTAAIRPQIEAAIRTYIDSVQPGGEIVRQKIAARVAAFAGVHDVSVPTINGSPANLTLDDDPAQVGSLSTLTLTAGTV